MRAWGEVGDVVAHERRVKPAIRGRRNRPSPKLQAQPPREPGAHAGAAGDGGSRSPERQSMVEDASGTTTRPASVMPKHPPHTPPSASGVPANGDPPHAWKSAPSWHRRKVVLVSRGRAPREDRSRGPRSQPALPEAWGKMAAERP